MPVTFGEWARARGHPLPRRQVKRPNPEDGTVGKFYALGTADIEDLPPVPL